ncbi:MAG TPA: wax ester/triacylglycerol synthase domain-containing protein [Pseudonocardia sp.]|nr:wax ester/triacylglycerol synthase domain-containing protein [Pseudonocardia sp.]
MTSGRGRLTVSTTSPSGLAEQAAPSRLLVVSAAVGPGRHAGSAAAVEERAARLWPDCEIRRVDVLDAMGRVTGPALRRLEGRRLPWLSDLGYRELCRRVWFADATRRVTGALAGRALRPVVDGFHPDLVVSTYPLGTSGLDWLRRRGRLEVPVAAIVADFAPHPLAVYAEIDLHYVASEPSLFALWRSRPDARAAVGAPPVISAFHPVDGAERAAARAALGLPVGRPVALVSGGALGAGSVRRAVDAALDADPAFCVVVACGQNEVLRHGLIALGEPADRLLPLGRPDRLPELTSAADVVITGAGGATALEAVATGRAVLLFEPAAGHGRANAALMERAGLGRVCADAGELTATLRELVGTPGSRLAAERRAAEHAGALDFTAEVAALPTLTRHRGSRPLAAADALYVAAATAEVPQQVGAVALLNPAEAAALDPERIAVGLRARLAARADQLPLLRRRLWTRPGRRPRWLVADELDASRQITSRVVGAGDGTSWAEAVREFFDAPVPVDRPPWQLEVLRDVGDGAGRTAVLAKLHHALGDGLVVTATLAGLLSDRPAPGLRAVPEAGGGARARAGARLARRLSRGLVRLVTAGRTALEAPRASSSRRRYALIRLPAAGVRALARQLGTSTTALLLGLLGEALHRHGGLVGNPVGGANGRLRTLVPSTANRVRRGPAGWAAGPEAPGNDPAAVLLDLPVGEMAVRERIAEVAEALDGLRAGHSVAARLAVLTMGRLQGALPARLGSLVYGGRFFGLIASVLPSWRRELRVLGAQITSVYPVLPLADGVGLAVGYLSWGEVLGVGVTADSALFPDAAGFADTLLGVFGEVFGEVADQRLAGQFGAVAGHV